MTDTTNDQKPAAAAPKRGRHHKLFAYAGPRAASFLRLLPALLAGLLALRAAELLTGMDPGTSPALAARVCLAAAGLDLLSLARNLPLLFLLSLPFVPRTCAPARLGFFWSVLLVLQLCLTQYFFMSGVPLGSDLFAYTVKDIAKTVAGTSGYSPALFVSFFAAMAALWGALRLCPRLPAGPPEKASLLALAATLPLALFAPAQPGTIGGFTEHQRSLAVNKAAFFIDESFRYLNPLKRGAAATGASSGMDLGRLAANYPFLREERTFDTLGPFFKPGGRPPNFVFFIAEGLGRGFSGPGAVFGSFTPKLDKLAAEGLYWENFLANQGRTFGVLPALFGSLPFGRNGLAELGMGMPPHVTLLSLLKKAGWRIGVYCGFNSDFDNDRAFYTLNGADSITDELSFGPGYEKSTSWGYADRELIGRYLQDAGRLKEPFVSVIKTSTMHTPYRFRGQEAYYAAFEKRLDELGVPADRKEAYRRYRDIYTCILYFDDEISRLITELRKRPEWENTVFVLTGDHRLPEIPMTTRLSRYYVPLLVLSPRLKAPARFKSVSSQLDVAPALLAFLSANYGLKTPRRVTWLGAGLDTAPEFRSVQTFPMMQTKTDLVDFISGSWYLNQDTVYRLGDSMQITPSDDKEALRSMRAKFAAFRAANDLLARTNALLPPGEAPDEAPYVPSERLKLPDSLGEDLAPGLAVREVRAPDSAAPGELGIEVTFACPGKEPSPVFVPLVVLMTADAKELTETYGSPVRLQPDGSATVKLDVKTAKVPPGRYFLAVIPSHPDTGKAVGAGKYKIPVQLAGRRK